MENQKASTQAPDYIGMQGCVVVGEGSIHLLLSGQIPQAMQLTPTICTPPQKFRDIV